MNKIITNKYESTGEKRKMHQKYTNVLVSRTSKASNRNQESISFEFEHDSELKEMVELIMASISELPASYAKKERALIMINEILFLGLTTVRRHS